MEKNSQSKIIKHMRKQFTIVKPQQTAQMGNTFNHPFDPYKNNSKIELHGYFFNTLTKNSILLIWKIDMVSFW